VETRAGLTKINLRPPHTNFQARSRRCGKIAKGGAQSSHKRDVARGRSRDTLARSRAKTVPEWKSWMTPIGEEKPPRRVNPLQENCDEESFRRTVMKKYVFAGLLVAGFVTPAFAAEYYVAQNNSTHKCSIVSKKPDGKTLTMLGTDGFKTKSAAESALKGMTECKA
jgi:hypothetical protein